MSESYLLRSHFIGIISKFQLIGKDSNNSSINCCSQKSFHCYEHYCEHTQRDKTLMVRRMKVRVTLREPEKEIQITIVPSSKREQKSSVQR
jgi:hypothetical protein